MFVLADRRDLPRRHGGGRLAYLSGAGRATEPRAGRHLWPIVIVPLVAFLLPASQDIVALLTRRPRPWLAALVGLGLLALLIELGERNVHEFVYFQF